MSVTNFTKETKELSEEEKLIIPWIISGFQTKTKESPIKAPTIVKKVNEILLEKGRSFKLSEVRLRKICNYIRSNGLLPLIATSNGYFVSYDKKEIESQIDSLKDRAYAILNSAKGLEKFL